MLQLQRILLRGPGMIRHDFGTRSLSRPRGFGVLSSGYIGALIIRLGFWGPLHYNYNKEPPKLVFVIIKAPTLNLNPLDPL